MDCQRDKGNDISEYTMSTCSSLEDKLLDCLIKSNAVFKSQQKDEPELSSDEKRKIASNLLKENHCLFLAKFGHYLQPEHLSYFDKDGEDNYETSYHIKRLHRYFNSSKRQLDIKNRRYKALKSLINEGDYFSEREMMKRNPLLYEQLIGQYLTEDQKKVRDNIEKKDISYVDILMESMDRYGNLDSTEAEEEEEEEEEEDEEKEGKKEDALEENDWEREFDGNSDTNQTSLKQEMRVQWGEECILPSAEKAQKLPKRINFEPWRKISDYEKQILRKEFETHMHQSFLEGKDSDFDYSTVDNNEEYDNIDLRTQDEEEKYFDSESPETVSPKNGSALDQSDDELDAYMNSLKEQITVNKCSTDSKA